MLLDFNLEDDIPEWKDPNTVEILDTVHYIRKEYNARKWFSTAAEYYPEVNFRHIIAPSIDLGGTYDFSAANAQRLTDLGIKDAKA